MKKIKRLLVDRPVLSVIILVCAFAIIGLSLGKFAAIFAG